MLDNAACHDRLWQFRHVGVKLYVDGLAQERRNSIANALELRLYCTSPLIYDILYIEQTIRTQT